ncbi:phosphodiesterase [Segnochrobactrum spirostomi]|uniref:phosphodiesterase n=1 Tax=Segnochrobactrum spirostomi TaxID=2608987 RepID=UPI00129800CB|nr:phosphodiesterase [Segnochrobactrum spirostomi]
MILIAQLTDLHLRPRGLPALRVVETATMVRRAVARVLALDPRPDAVVITGDIADTPDPREYELARDLLSPLPMPVYAVPGNHDSSEALRTAFADAAWAHQSAAGSLQFAVDVGPVRLVGLDTNVPDETHGFLGAERLDFARNALAAAPDRPTLMALHHPPIPSGMKDMDAIGLRDADALAALVRANPQVGLVVAGHVHRPYVAPFGGAVGIVAPSVCHQTVLNLSGRGKPLFAFEPPAFLLHAWSAETGFISHTIYVEDAAGPYDYSRASGVLWPD